MPEIAWIRLRGRRRLSPGALTTFTSPPDREGTTRAREQSPVRWQNTQVLEALSSHKRQPPTRLIKEASTTQPSLSSLFTAPLPTIKTRVTVEFIFYSMMSFLYKSDPRARKGEPSIATQDNSIHQGCPRYTLRMVFLLKPQTLKRDGTTALGTVSHQTTLSFLSSSHTEEKLRGCKENSSHPSYAQKGHFVRPVESLRGPLSPRIKPRPDRPTLASQLGC